jgi:hypothetical protein
MKNITPVLLLAAILSGCGPQKKDPVKEAPQKAAHAANNAPLFHYGNPVLLQYDRYLAALDTQLVEMGSQAIDTFQLLFKNQPAAVCDTAFYIFDQYHSILCNYLETHMEQDSIDYMDFISLDDNNKPKALSKKHKAKKRALEKNGFYLDSEEGMVFITRDRHYIAQHFGKYVSAPMKQYLVQLGKEQKEGFEADAGLMIEPAVLVDRTVWWENFSKANPNFLYAKEAAYNRRITLYALILGMDNTSVRAFVSDTLSQDSLSAYFNTAWKYAQEKHPQSATSAIVTPFYNAWMKRDTLEINKATQQFEKEYVLTNP